MKRLFAMTMVLLALLLLTGCSDGNSPKPIDPMLMVVNSLLDPVTPTGGVVTLRSAIELVDAGGTISFDPALDGQTIRLEIVGQEHSVLKGEVMGFDYDNNISYLVGYFERDYGKSALYARKNLVIDASALTDGITLEWTGSEDARVLAVYGDLTMNNVILTGGSSVAEEIAGYDPEAEPGAENSQPWSLGRGGAVAVWGEARLTNCTLHDNHCLGDFDQSRDRGAFGGGLYADIVHLSGCVISGNSVVGGGAAGGGVYSVGGADTTSSVSTIEQSSITGNRISALFTYGGGVYSDGGGIGKRKTLAITNSTIARNLVEPAPGMPPFMLGMGYWRGGGLYMSNGYLTLKSCTLVENEVSGLPRTDDLGKRNLAGGIAATIGDAHAVESMTIAQSIITGNLVNELGLDGSIAYTYPHDIFTGSLLHFFSGGHNRIGVIDFSQILVPVGEEKWKSLSRKHYPQDGDKGGINVTEVLDLIAGVTHSDQVLSVGVDADEPAVLWYQPRGTALDQVPATYQVDETYAECEIADEATNDFLAIVLSRLESHFELPDFANSFTLDFETYLQEVDTDDEVADMQPYTDPDGNPILTLADTQWFGPAVTWPKESYNFAYIEFWHRLDEALESENISAIGDELLGEDVWTTLFSQGPLDENNDIIMNIFPETRSMERLNIDQRGILRSNPGDIGAIELEP